MDILELVHDDQKSEDRPFQCKYKNCPKAFSRLSTSLAVRGHKSGPCYEYADFTVTCVHEQDMSQPQARHAIIGRRAHHKHILLPLRHARIHSNERPFACQYRGCGKTFIQRSALTVHLRVHTGERPHVCETCSKAFSDSSSLARHRRIHSGRRPYRCLVEGCGKTYCRKTTLTKHTRRNHAAILKSTKLRNGSGAGPVAIGSNSAPANFLQLHGGPPMQMSHSWGPSSYGASPVSVHDLEQMQHGRQAMHHGYHSVASLTALSLAGSSIEDEPVSHRSGSFDGSSITGADTTHTSVGQPFSPMQDQSTDMFPTCLNGAPQMHVSPDHLHHTQAPFYYGAPPHALGHAHHGAAGMSDASMPPLPPPPFYRDRKSPISPTLAHQINEQAHGRAIHPGYQLAATNAHHYESVSAAFPAYETCFTQPIASSPHLDHQNVLTSDPSASGTPSKDYYHRQPYSSAASNSSFIVSPIVDSKSHLHVDVKPSPS